MKKTLFVLFLICSSVFTRAQECQDIVYTSGGDNIIFNCCIVEVKYGNVVYYIKDDRQHIIEADKIVKDGETIILKPYETDPEFDDYRNEGFQPQKTEKEPGRQEFEYNYYKKKYEGAKVQMGIGIFLTITGGTANIASIVLAVDDKTSNDGAAIGLNVYGIIAFNVGLPLWISGAIRKGNNYRAMQRSRSAAFVPKSLNLSTTEHGLGLVLRF